MLEEIKPMLLSILLGIILFPLHGNCSEKVEKEINISASSRLTESDYNNLSIQHSGYLYNIDLNMYVRSDINNKWIYADAAEPGSALSLILAKTKIQQVPVAMFANIVNGQIRYLNWREITGAVKLYESYNNMVLNWMSDGSNSFTITSFQQEELMGTKSKSDTELYYRKDSYNNNFQFILS